ncbi:MAG: DUF1552 domain-containing protein [Planctomycetes bacterium]|nr:DUF1552 domain-containing protein [Planctomycetota bacterium]
MSRSFSLTRRTLLRGVGATLALPWLEAMRPAIAAASGNPPVRTAFIYVPGGVNVDEWLPRGEGADYQSRFTLEALAPVREDVLVLSGLDGREGETGANGHPLGCAPWLSSAPLNEKDRGGYATGVSVDQIAAQHVGQDTLLPSLELGCDRDATELYSSNVSWRGPASPMGKEVNPRAVFNRLFGDPSADAHQRSILDVVLEDARNLRTHLGGIDRQKLDEYLDSVRAIERRIQVAERQSESRPTPSLELPEAVPEDFTEHLRLLLDLLVLAFQTDNTRVATFMFNNEAGRASWPELGISEGHHGLAHLDPRTAEGQDKLEKLRRIDRWYVEQFVYLLEKMKGVREGEGTLLDNAMILYGSGLAWGRLHNRENLPILLAGRGGGTIDPGRHIACGGRPLADLYLAMLQRVGVNRDRIADSTGPLPRLTA